MYVYMHECVYVYVCVCMCVCVCVCVCVQAESGLTGKPKWVTDMALCVPQNKVLLTTGSVLYQFSQITSLITFIGNEISF